MRPAAVQVEEEWITGCDRIWGDEDDGEMGEVKHVMIEEEEDGENGDDDGDSIFSSSRSTSTSTSSSTVSLSSTLRMVRTLRSAGVDQCLSPSDSARSIDFSLFFDPCPPLSLGSHLHRGLGQERGPGSVPGVAAIKKHRKDKDKDKDVSKVKGKGKEGARARHSKGGDREEGDLVSQWKVEKEVEKAEWAPTLPLKCSSILRPDPGSDSVLQPAVRASESQHLFIPLPLESQREDAGQKSEKECADDTNIDRPIRSHVTATVTEIPDTGPGSVMPSDSEESDGDVESGLESLDTAQVCMCLSYQIRSFSFPFSILFCIHVRV